jgi:hypothetical protein
MPMPTNVGIAIGAQKHMAIISTFGVDPKIISHNISFLETKGSL